MKIRTKLLAIWEKVEVAMIEVEQRLQELRHAADRRCSGQNSVKSRAVTTIWPESGSNRGRTKGEDEKLASVQILGNRMRLSTLAPAALIFGIAGLSALWLFVIAGLAVLCSVLIAFVARFSRRARIINSSSQKLRA